MGKGGGKGGKSGKVVVAVVTAIFVYFSSGSKPPKFQKPSPQQQAKAVEPAPVDPSPPPAAVQPPAPVQLQPPPVQPPAPVQVQPPPVQPPAPVQVQPPAPVQIQPPPVDPPAPVQVQPPPAQPPAPVQQDPPLPTDPPASTQTASTFTSTGLSSVTSIQGAAGMSSELTYLVTQSFQAVDLVTNPLETVKYVETFFDGAATRGMDANIGLPGYSYFQGMIIGGGKLDVVGQVRVVGGVLVDSDARLQGGAMVTTTPEAQVERVQAVRSRWQVESWNEE